MIKPREKIDLLTDRTPESAHSNGHPPCGVCWVRVGGYDESKPDTCDDEWSLSRGDRRHADGVRRFASIRYSFSGDTDHTRERGRSSLSRCFAVALPCALGWGGALHALAARKHAIGHTVRFCEAHTSRAMKSVSGSALDFLLLFSASIYRHLQSSPPGLLTIACVPPTFCRVFFLRILLYCFPQTEDGLSSHAARQLSSTAAVTRGRCQTISCVLFKAPTKLSQQELLSLSLFRRQAAPVEEKCHHSHRQCQPPTTSSLLVRRTSLCLVRAMSLRRMTTQIDSSALILLSTQSQLWTPILPPRMGAFVRQIDLVCRRWRSPSCRPHRLVEEALSQTNFAQSSTPQLLPG